MVYVDMVIGFVAESTATADKKSVVLQRLEKHNHLNRQLHLPCLRDIFRGSGLLSAILVAWEKDPDWFRQIRVSTS